jgi:hypothetical protein
MVGRGISTRRDQGGYRAKSADRPMSPSPTRLLAPNSACVGSWPAPHAVRDVGFGVSIARSDAQLTANPAIGRTSASIVGEAEADRRLSTRGGQWRAIRPIPEADVQHGVALAASRPVRPFQNATSNPYSGRWKATVIGGYVNGVRHQSIIPLDSGRYLPLPAPDTKPSIVGT